MRPRVQATEKTSTLTSVAPARLRRLPALSPKVIHIDSPHRDERRRVERFVEQTFARAYGGRLSAHYPTLMSVQDCAGRIYAVVGFRLASESGLFLEQYLPSPVEAAIADICSGPGPQRSQVAEIGNLASDGRGATIVLFLALAEHLRRLGCDYAVATATRQLRGIFAKAGVLTHELAAADPQRLADRGAAWGSYYESDPIVLAGSIPASLPSLNTFAGASATPPLRSRLHYGAGQE